MMSKSKLFTSESVSVGHPDKVADQISDAVLDSMLHNDRNARVACETLIKGNLVVLAGEITANGFEKVNLESVVKNVIREIGYTSPEIGCNANDLVIQNELTPQSPEISQGVTEGEGAHKEQGAGDQGLMFGFACNETQEYMPLPIQISHKLMEQQKEVREKNTIPFLRPDAKSQVTIDYTQELPTLNAVVLSTSHGPEWSKEKDQIELHKLIEKEIINPVLENYHSVVNFSKSKNYSVHINPTGSFEFGGPMADAGLTGRKIIVDTYGGRGRHGGGAFSGKDATKVDRSAAYMARYIAKNIVAAELASECEVQLSYAIGEANPISINIDCFDTHKINEDILENSVKEIFSLSPAGILKELRLKNPIYLPTAAHGHFGRSYSESKGSFSWESLDKVAELQKLIATASL